MVAITEVVDLEQKDEIAVIYVDNPPVNALGYEVRRGLSEGLSMVARDDTIKAAVVICRGRTYIAGADIREFGKPPKGPEVNVFEAINSCDKPVVCAIHGTAFGGGLEFALTCYFRVAVASAKFGFPEVKLGLVPGGGGTQRLPRLTGPEKALEMISTGNPIGAAEALKNGLIDEIVQDDLEEGAIAFARKAVAENLPLVKISDAVDKIEAYKGKPEVFDNFRKSKARRFRGFDAPEACIKCVDAAINLPFDEGIKYERKTFLNLMQGSQSAAQRYYFFAERQVRKIPDIPKDTPKLDIKSAAIIGAGTMGGGIAMNCVNAGIPVTLIETTRELLDRGLGVIKKNYEITVSKGKLNKEDAEKRMSLIKGSISIEDVADADIVIEAVYENMDLKKEIFTKLDAICKEDALLGTNTSALNVDEIAGVTKRPESVIGLHFFSPANVMKLLEIVRGAKTSKTVLATSITFAKTIKKIAVVVGVCPGFAGNRMFGQREREVQNLLSEGASIAQLDKAFYDFGFPMGPITLRDLIGLDLGWSKETSTGATIRDRLCELGRVGLKSGAGYYRYEPGNRVPIPDPEVEQLIADYAKEKGYTPRDVTDEEIIQRCIYPVVNEGLKILEEKISVRPSDLDVIWINGYGWPVYTGGPMFWGDLIGVEKILETMKKFHGEHGDLYKPAPLLEKLVAEGKAIRDLN